MLLAILFGFAFGFVGSVPLAGPIAILVFARGLARAYRDGLAIAAGSALAESVYACLAYWGAGQLALHFPTAARALQIVSAFLLLGLGAYFLLVARPRSPVEPAGPPRPREGFLLGFGLTALNPTFLATWSAAVSTLHSVTALPASAPAAAVFGASAGAGIFAWFRLLLWLMRRHEGWIREPAVSWVTRAVGAALAGMGLWALAGLVRAP